MNVHLNLFCRMCEKKIKWKREKKGIWKEQQSVNNLWLRRLLFIQTHRFFCCLRTLLLIIQIVLVYFQRIFRYYLQFWFQISKFQCPTDFFFFKFQLQFTTTKLANFLAQTVWVIIICTHQFQFVYSPIVEIILFTYRSRSNAFSECLFFVTF